jgi:DNA-binding transcriptional regulator GbsR (MarR family)
MRPEVDTFQEKVGDYFHRIGQPRIAGRLFGYLLICDPPEQNAHQLKDAIGASSGSVSTMLRLLQGAGFVESRGEVGGRRLWYRISPGAFSRALTLRMKLVSDLRALAEAGLDEVGSEGGEVDRLLEMRDCYAFFEEELPLVVARYEQASRPGQ